MVSKDVFHNAVKYGLQKEGWTITDDPLYIRIPGIQMYVDLGAEKVIGAEREGQRIAVEIKSFIGPSAISQFHAALGQYGQYLNYQQALEELESERVLYLAVPQDTYKEFFVLPFIQGIVQRHHVKLIVYEPTEEVLVTWLT